MLHLFDIIGDYTSDLRYGGGIKKEYILNAYILDFLPQNDKNLSITLCINKSCYIYIPKFNK